MKIEIEPATDLDRQRAAVQIGAENKVYGIVARCPHGAPKVLVLNPVINVEREEINYSSLANLVWLSCPFLRKIILDLENSGMVSRAQQLLHKDRAMATLMNDAHAHFYYFRKEMFRLMIGRPYRASETSHFDVGIGGIKDIRVVKCLHLHYAHFSLCPTNIVGRAVEGLIGGTQYSGCGDGRCMKS
jgi:uncharacterized protein